MANLLILNLIIPYPLHYNGNSVRVLPLSAELTKSHRCYLAAFGTANERSRDLQALGIYADILLLPPLPTRHPRWRHLFWRTGNLYRRLHPGYYRDCVSQLQAFVERNGIDLVLAHTMMASEFAEPLKLPHKIVDVIDSRTLYLERQYANAQSGTTSLWWRIKARREFARAGYQESRLLMHFEHATTISARDSATLRSLTGGGDRVSDLPNGFPPELERWREPDGSQGRSICFWGALDFPPNTTAVRYFYEKVFLPYLAHSDLTWYIIGRNPTSDILALTDRHANIRVTGYLEDLFGFVSRIPIMINPMLIGGGLKNKVLEAFALRRAVVSNSLGMEAIDATPGEHYLAAESPAEFASRIQELLDDPARAAGIGQAARELVLSNYSWAAVGERLRILVEQSLRDGDRRDP